MKNRIMILNDIAWPNCRAVVYNELYQLFKLNNIQMTVIHISLTSNAYEVTGRSADLSIHKYPYDIFVYNNFESTTLFGRIFIMLKKIRKFRPNAIILMGYYDLSYFIIILVSKILKIKLIEWMESTENSRPRIWYKEIYKEIFLKLCDIVFCTGTAAKKYLERLKIDTRHIFVTNLTPDFQTIEKICKETWNKREELKKEHNFKAYNFLYVGRLSKEKNLELLIKAFSQVKKENYKSANWGLIIAGDGPEIYALKKLIMQLGVSDICFMQGKTSEAISVYYAISDVFILPSNYETWGIVVNEAMICSLPVVISNRCGSAYDLVQEGQNGFTFHSDNINELVNIMLKFIVGEVSMHKMGQRSREIINNYTPQNSAQQMLKGIKFILGAE